MKEIYEAKADFALSLYEEMLGMAAAFTIANSQPLLFLEALQHGEREDVSKELAKIVESKLNEGLMPMEIGSLDYQPPSKFEEKMAHLILIFVLYDTAWQDDKINFAVIDLSLAKIARDLGKMYSQLLNHGKRKDGTKNIARKRVTWHSGATAIYNAGCPKYDRYSISRAADEVIKVYERKHGPFPRKKRPLENLIREIRSVSLKKA